jgi:hypothetical protein
LDDLVDVTFYHRRHRHVVGSARTLARRKIEFAAL